MLTRMLLPEVQPQGAQVAAALPAKFVTQKQFPLLIVATYVKIRRNNTVGQLAYLSWATANSRGKQMFAAMHKLISL